MASLGIRIGRSEFGKPSSTRQQPECGSSCMLNGGLSWCRLVQSLVYEEFRYQRQWITIALRDLIEFAVIDAQT